MASELIQITCAIWPAEQGSKANASGYQLPQVNNVYNPEGVLMPDDLDSRCHFRSLLPVPSWVNATPNGKLRITFVPNVGSGNVKLAPAAFTTVPNTTSLDPAAPTALTAATSTVAAIYVERTMDFALTALAAGLISGNFLQGYIDRNASTDAADTCEEAIIITTASLILDDNS